MIKNISHFATGFLHKMDPEHAHDIAITGLSYTPFLSKKNLSQNCETLKTTMCNMVFNHPIGMAAGFDKNAQAYEGLLHIGFSFVETGTVTPISQEGNAKPRIFRLSQDKALINRLGFNNQGLTKIAERLKKNTRKHDGIIGINIGANKNSVDRINDYVIGLQNLMPLTDYCTANISSPNTPDLRNLQQDKPLNSLLERLCKAKQQLNTKEQRPLFLKISPDMTSKELQSLAKIIQQYPIDAVIISNTTISRPETLTHTSHNQEQGGLSGVPLYSLSTQTLAQFYVLTEGKIPLIGVGGIHDTHTALKKIKAGASLLQLYTGFVYKGPCIINEICEGLKKTMKSDNKKHIKDYIGTQAQQIAQIP